MFAYLTRLTMLIGYASAMVISVVAHDPFHHHAPEVNDAPEEIVQTTHNKGSIRPSHHHHGHHHHTHDLATHDLVKTPQSGKHSHSPHHHSHHHHGDEDCRVCDFLSLKCIEATVAVVESAGELLTLTSQNALCYHEAFSPYQPPSRAPPVC